MPPRTRLTRYSTPEFKMAAEDLEWERSKISNQDVNLLKRLGLMKKEDAIRFPSEESYPNPPMEYRVSFVDHLIRGLSTPIHDFLRGLLFVYGIQLHQLTPNSILHISIFITLLSNDLSVKDLEKLIRRITSLSKKDPIPSSCRVEPYSATNPLPENHPTMASLPPLPEDGEVEERGIITDDNQEAPSFVNDPVDSRKSAKTLRRSNLLLPPFLHRGKGRGVMPKIPAHPKPKKLFLLIRRQLMILILNPSDDEEEVPTRDVAPRTSTSHTLVISEKPVEGEESSPPQQNVDTSTPPSSPLVPSPKRVEMIIEPPPQLSSSSSQVLDDPMIKDLIRIGSQFIGYREYASRTEVQTNQDFDLENPDNDPLLDALSYLELHGREIREGVANASAGLSALFPYFFPKKEEPSTFLALAKIFNSSEDLGLRMRQENMKAQFLILAEDQSE
ncbi:hypothetical protein QYE76_024995 [Lolium multiflorum]|uniref:Transposase (putative) gypsy type domain-containing protein n=1 Tax=Lolium multiflorum TaxID=4521 RepID=A0AAD8RD68_LOLMU|nr:hypothetical protein QYE76_024995 [Lolium multiflorum]